MAKLWDVGLGDAQPEERQRGFSDVESSEMIFPCNRFYF